MKIKKMSRREGRKWAGNAEKWKNLKQKAFSSLRRLIPPIMHVSFSVTLIAQETAKYTF